MLGDREKRIAGGERETGREKNKERETKSRREREREIEREPRGERRGRGEWPASLAGQWSPAATLAADGHHRGSE